jgi:hypothetical protein
VRAETMAEREREREENPRCLHSASSKLFTETVVENSPSRHCLVV